MSEQFSSQLSEAQRQVADAVASLGKADRLIIVGRAGSGKSHAVAAGLAAREPSPDIRDPRILVVAGARVLADQWAWNFDRMGEQAVVVDPSQYRDLQLHTAHGENPWKTPQVRLVATYIDFVKQPERLQQLLQSRWDVIVLDDLPASQPDTMRHQALSALWSSGEPCSRVLVTWTGEAGVVPDLGDAMVLELDVDVRRWRTTEVPISYSTEESQTLEWIYSKASNLSGILGQTILRRAGSSLSALEQSLARLTVKIHQSVEASETPDDAPVLPPADGIEVSEITPILDAIENLDRDAKWETFRSALSSIAGAGPVVVFTDFADTAEYLSYLLQTEDVPAIAITGRMSADERAAAFEEASGTNHVLVVSNPTGPQLAALSGVFHYDLPANPGRLEERYEFVANLPDDTAHRVMVDPVFDRVRGRTGSS